MNGSTQDDRPRDADASIAEQQRFWNAWNAEYREDEARLAPVNRRQAEQVLQWLSALHRDVPLDIVEVGCGSGWFCERMRAFGVVRGIDLSDQILERSRMRFPGVDFVAGDFMQMQLPPLSADVVVGLEVLSHIADQTAFVGRLAQLLRPDGHLMLATQNRFVLERTEGVQPPGLGQVRRWVDAATLRGWLRPHFEVIQLKSLHPTGHRGVLRWVNSRKLESLLRKMGFAAGWTTVRERSMLGHTLIVLARKRASTD